MKLDSLNTLHEKHSEHSEDAATPQYTNRSEVAQEIISHKNGFIEKWALMIFFMILLFLLLMSSFIKYPDTVVGHAIISGEEIPKEIMAHNNAKIVSLFITNNQIVKEGEVLAWLESTADIKQVNSLAKSILERIEALRNGDLKLVLKLSNENFNNLGELQTPYQFFLRAWQQYNDYTFNGFYKKKKAMLYQDIASLSNNSSNGIIEYKMNKQNNELAKETFEMYEKLYHQKVISAEEYRQAQSRLLNSEKTIPQNNVNISNQQNQIRDKQKEIDQLEHAFVIQETIFEQELFSLKSKIDEWLKKFTIQAPASGKVVLIFPMQKGQFVEPGKILGYVNPVNTKYHAELRLSQNNLGKVDTGMKVQLRLDAYPYQEIGHIEGTLGYLSTIAVDSVFWGKVYFNNGLTTNQGKRIEFKNGLSAKAIIVTQNMTLFKRLYKSITNMNVLEK